MKVSSLGRSARSKAGIKVRQPLAVNYVSFSSEGEKRALESKAIKQMVQDELNVKRIQLATPEELSELAKKDGYVVDDEAAPSTAIYKYLSEDPKEAEELRKEGIAREVVHRLQTMRRSAGFDIADYIITYYQGDAYVKQVLEDEALTDYIRQETLSRQLVEGVPGEDVFTESYKLGGHDILLGVRRLN
jgi:isoleucyl-tRNA synthetase